MNIHTENILSMFTIKNWEKGFLWVDYKEHHIIDIRKQEPTPFEVSTKAYPNYPSDFIKETAFDQKQYCICLLRTTLELSKDEMEHFLKHQCSLMEDPLEWLYKFDELLEIALKFKPTKSNKIRFEILKTLVVDLSIEMADFAAEPKAVYSSQTPSHSNEPKNKYELSGLVDELVANPGYKKQISILNRLRASYLKQKGATKEDPFVIFVDLISEPLKEAVKFSSKDKKKMKQFIGTGIQLARFYSDMRKSKNKDGALVTNLKISKEARWISDNYLDKDGKLYPESTIRKYLTSNNNTDFYNAKNK